MIFFKCHGPIPHKQRLENTTRIYHISSRYRNTAGYINGHGSEFIWKLCGKWNILQDLPERAAACILMRGS